MKHVGSAPSDDGPICKKRLIEAKQNLGPPGFVPKWTKSAWTINNTRSQCINPKCAHTQCGELTKPASDDDYLASLVYSFLKQTFRIYTAIILGVHSRQTQTTYIHTART